MEKAIAKVTGGTVAHVVGHPRCRARTGGRRGRRVATDGAEFDEAALRAQLKAELSAYKIPRRFVAVPRAEIPLLSSGKVDLAALKRLFDA